MHNYAKKKSTSNENLITLLRLARSENVSTKLFYNLINFFGDASLALSNISDLSLKGGRSKPINICSKADAEKELEALDKVGGGIISYLDDNYPQLLLNIYDPPPLLSYLGNPKLFNTRILSVVGARNCSANAMAFTKKITQELQGLNFAIASGLARGIDTVAHKASLPNTIAVIAGGLGHVYPPENKDLYHEIAKHGLIVAELPFGTAPLAQHFPQRNRIISGISLATIVMEASLQSGSLITAKFALDQGREVFAVPGFPLDPRSSGTNKLIKDGALVVENVADIVNNLPTLEYYKSKFEELKANFVKEKLISSDSVDAEARKAIISLLSGAPIDVEIIVQYTNLPINIVNIVLLELELANKILRSSSNKITLLYQ